MINQKHQSHSNRQWSAILTMKGNKKAQGLEVASIPRLIVVTIMFFGLIFITSTSQSDQYSMPHELRASILADKFITSSYCLAYLDSDTDIIAPNTIDFEKFSEENLNNCYYVGQDSKTPGFRAYLKYGDPEEQKLFQSKNWAGTFGDTTITRNVYLVKGDEIEEATLTFQVKNA